MSQFEVFGRLLVLIGISLAIIGGIVWIIGRIGGFNGFPGTLRVEGNGVTCIFPILASILLSIVLTVVLNLIIRLLNR